MPIHADFYRAIQSPSFIAYLTVFLAGAVLGFGSCIVIRVPVIIGYISGISPSRKKAFFITLAYMGGLILVYSLLGLLFGFIASMVRDLVRWSGYFYYGLGLIALILGLHFVGLLRLKFPIRSRNNPATLIDRLIQSLRQKYGLIGAFILGGIVTLFEAPACPVCGPVLLILASYTVLKGRFIYGLTIFFAYALGQSFSLFLVGNFIGIIKHTKSMARWLQYTKLVGGEFLILLGLLLFWIA